MRTRATTCAHASAAYPCTANSRAPQTSSLTKEPLSAVGFSKWSIGGPGCSLVRAAAAWASETRADASSGNSHRTPQAWFIAAAAFQSGIK